jgi:hypothetical protein
MQRYRYGILVIALFATLAHAQSINVPNFSFEEPDATGQTAVPFASSWALSGPDMLDIGLGFPVNIGTGVFRNPASGIGRFDNADQNQLAYIFPEDGHQFVQTLVATFQAGQQYQLTVGVGLAGTSPSSSNSLELALYHVAPGAPSVPIFLASRIVKNDGTDGLVGAHLLDFTASSAFLGGDDPAVGRQINILIRSIGTNQTGQFSFDNVRLVAVPEPGSLAAIGAATMLLSRRRRLS